MDALVISKTRITIPRRRSDLITRQRLLDLLDQALEKKLILVTAPSGYGKTSLLIDYANNSVLPFCWYSVDPLDIDPHRFISHFISAISLRFPKVGQRSLAALQNSNTNLDGDYLATVLVNDLFDAVTEHFVLVVDDFQWVVENTLIRNFISRFLQDVDENCHLILTSRTLLPMPILTTLAMRSEAEGFDFESLAFTVDEIRTLFHQNTDNVLPEQDAKELHNRTEGWITGILLASRTNLNRPIARPWLGRAPGVRLEDYFQQLVDQQPEEMVSFLLRTSLLEEFNAERCAEIIGNPLGLETIDWQGLMNKAQQENLFILPVGEDGSWLRYHRLFLDYLQTRMRREHLQETELIERALARWHIQRQAWEDAFTIYKRLGATNDLVALVEQVGTDLIVKGRLQTLSAWLDTLPAEILSARPFIISLQGAVAGMTGNSSLAISLYNQAIEAMQLPEDRQYLARALAWRAVTHRLAGNLAVSMADSRESLGLIDNDPELVKVKAENLRCIGLCLSKQGKLAESLTWLQQALATSQSIRDEENCAIIRLGLGLAFENLGRFAESKEMYQAALEHWQKTDNNVWLANLLNNLGALQHLTGDYEQAIHSYEMALHHARISHNLRYEAFVMAGIGDLYSDLDSVAEARLAYTHARQLAERIQVRYLQIYVDVQEAALLTLEGDEGGAGRLLEHARALTHHDRSMVETFLYELEFAGLRIHQGKAEQAIDDLERVAAYFEAEGHKNQRDKAELYLILAYGQVQRYEKLVENLLKLLASLNSGNPSPALIAAASRHLDALKRLSELDYLGGQMQELFSAVEQFRSQLPQLRRFMRQHPIAVPFGPALISIRALGKMQVRVNNHLVTMAEWQTQAARDLFFLILAHPEGLTKEEIGVILWPDASPNDLRFRIKNTVYRLRHAIGKDVILLDQESYRFNDMLDYEYDVEQFLRENAQGGQAHEALQKLAHYREAIKCYKGAYLPEVNETWVHSPRTCLQQNYLNILLQVAELYLEMANNDLALEYCQRAIEEDNCCEAAYRISFRIYSAMGDRAGIVRQYQRCVEILHREINTVPTPQTQMLYQELLK